MVAVRTPASTTGRASGASTRQKICVRDMPMPLAASTTAVETCCKPASVALTTGSNA